MGFITHGALYEHYDPTKFVGDDVTDKMADAWHEDQHWLEHGIGIGLMLAVFLMWQCLMRKTKINLNGNGHFAPNAWSYAGLIAVEVTLGISYMSSTGLFRPKEEYVKLEDGKTYEETDYFFVECGVPILLGSLLAFGFLCALCVKRGMAAGNGTGTKWCYYLLTYTAVAGMITVGTGFYAGVDSHAADPKNLTEVGAGVEAGAGGEGAAENFAEKYLEGGGSNSMPSMDVFTLTISLLFGIAILAFAIGYFAHKKSWCCFH